MNGFVQQMLGLTARVCHSEGMTNTPLTADELRARGNDAAESLPLEALATLVPLDRDPVAVIEAQNQTRLPELLPLRAERMSADAFSFFRGSAALMAQDLAAHPSSNLDLIICGDAHIMNFGLFASPERKLVFDLNDFDEASTGPWEWDVKRMLTSVMLAGRSMGIPKEELEQMSRDAAQTYRHALGDMLAMHPVDRLFSGEDEDSIRPYLSGNAKHVFEKSAKKANKRSAQAASEKLLRTHDDGSVVFIEQPPLLSRTQPEHSEFIEQLFEEYLNTVRPDVRILLSTFRIADIALRVVGVGSVGTRCYLMALTGADGNHLILQIKEAQQSVVTLNHLRAEPTIQVLPLGAPHGQRVTTYQQILQAASDPFLGHVEGRLHHFYVRQFRDRKGSLLLEDMNAASFALHAKGCAKLLARAHSQSPLATAVQAYLGDSDRADKALTT